MTHTHDDPTHNDPHDRGLAFDLQTLLARRHVLRVLGAAGATTLLAGGSFGGPPSNAEPNATGTAADGSLCLKDPGETSGPFPGDGTNEKDGTVVNVLTETGVLRQDIRPSFGTLTGMADGVQMDITLTLRDVANACAPLAGHAIYIWHCDAAGRYSLYDIADQNYLRGVALSDAAGQARFTTIFPACYPGRWPHIHFEIYKDQAAATTGKAALLTSQLAMPADTCAAIFAAHPAYAQSVTNLAALTLASDGVFADNTAEQIAAQTTGITGDASTGLTATAMIGVA